MTRWEVPGTPTEVMDVLMDIDSLPRWWPAVYLDAEVDAPTDVPRDATVKLYTKGWLPYTLTWWFQPDVVDPPRRLTLVARGDFNGVGEWLLTPSAGGQTVVTFSWHVQAFKPLLRFARPVLGPIFSANHAWAMRVGETSLALELARRRGEQVPAPPPATFPFGDGAFSRLYRRVVGGAG